MEKGSPMTKADAIDMYRTLGLLRNLPGTGSAKWAYAAAKNLAALTPEYQAVLAADSVVPQVLAEFESARLNLCKQHARRTPEGEPVMQDGNFAIENMDAFEAELRTYVTPEVKAAREQHHAAVRALLDEPCEVKLRKCAVADLPAGVTPAQVQTLEAMLSDDE